MCASSEMKEFWYLTAAEREGLAPLAGTAEGAMAQGKSGASRPRGGGGHRPCPASIDLLSSTSSRRCSVFTWQRALSRERCRSATSTWSLATKARHGVSAGSLESARSSMFCSSCTCRGLPPERTLPKLMRAWIPRSTRCCARRRSAARANVKSRWNAPPYAYALPLEKMWRSRPRIGSGARGESASAADITGRSIRPQKT
mmetsp:Transcript_23126/g.73381  ORF Transcript_23126/g.73381 Transcript_23126/m.73381 type:complete len:201 (-) Transcript_23126:388-990(-)